MIIEAIKSEYERYKSLAELAVNQVNHEGIHKIFGEDGNSIAVIIKHLSGNLKSRFTSFLNEDGEKAWRNRDSEFEDENESSSKLFSDWNEAFEIVYNQLNSLTDNDLNKIVVIRKNELTVIEALERSLTHLSYHVGQIVLIAKSIAGKQWKSLSIPKGSSIDYNLNPTKEKKPQ